MIPQTSFYLIRHGESEANLAGKAAGGGVDSSLTQTGIEQARALGDVIENLVIKPSQIFVSPMKRARHTAEIINTYLKLPVTIVENLEEHHVGEWEGQPWSMIGPRMKTGEAPPGGETYQQYADRVSKALTPVLSETYETPPMIVAHGGTFHSIGRMYNWKITETKNCHLHRFTPYPEHKKFPFQVWEYNVSGIDLRECRSPYCALYNQGDVT